MSRFYDYRDLRAARLPTVFPGIWVRDEGRVPGEKDGSSRLVQKWLVVNVFRDSSDP